jgi:hypothetical protein
MANSLLNFFLPALNHFKDNLQHYRYRRDLFKADENTCTQLKKKHKYKYIISTN